MDDKTKAAPVQFTIEEHFGQSSELIRRWRKSLTGGRIDAAMGLFLLLIEKNSTVVAVTITLQVVL